MKERENLYKKTNKGGGNCRMVVIGWFNLQLWMWVVDLNYNCECDWLIELSDNNLASESVESRSFLSQS